MATTGHNIANANTEGFSKQEVRNKTGITVGEGNVAMGTGVEIQSIKRAHDELVEKKLNSSTTGHMFNEERSLQLGQIEEVFNEINSEGTNKILNRFFNSFRELSNQPENETLRGMVRENAKIVVGDFHRVQANIDQIRTGINKKMSLACDDINQLCQNIAKLNVEVARIEVNGSDANDLRDQRDQAVRTLAEYFPVTCYGDEMGRYVVNVEGVGSLVAGDVVQKLMVGNNVNDANGSGGKGSQEIFFESKPSSSISSKIKQGTLGALIKTKTEELSQLENQMNELAHGLVLSTNAIHRRGFTNHSIPTDAAGEPMYRMAQHPVSNVNFFKEPLNFERAAEYLDISDEVKEDVNNIATALSPNTPGDNRVAIAISKLQHEKVMNGGSTSFEEHYLKSVGQIGLMTAKTKIDTEQSGGILAQSKSIKERLTGVSLDEETANMVRYQNTYEASAKVIRAADDMFKAVLGMMPG